MSFLKDVVAQSLPVWEACARTPFVRGLQDGTLAREKFRFYMIQDSIYLKHCARVYGKAIYQAETLQEIQVYYDMLRFVTAEESAVRLAYLKDFGITDDDIEGMPIAPENQVYIDFMFELAAQEENDALLMTVLPCMLSYSYIFRQLAAAPESRRSPYWDFIADYADEGYAKDCRRWGAFAERRCQGLARGRKLFLRDVFEHASVLELAFWGMADRGMEKGAVTNEADAKKF